jgi:hypothetical protein
LTQQKQTSPQQKEANSIARVESYLSYIERYPLYSTLLVLEEYEGLELYEECVTIKKALDKYNSTVLNREGVTKYTGKIEFPTKLSDYQSESFQKMLKGYNIKVEDKEAQEKATLIKLKLPL